MKRSTTILVLSAILLTTSFAATAEQNRAVAATATAQTATKAQIVSSVNLRDKPSTSGKIIELVKKGATVTILENSNSYFYKVKTSDGKTGYVSSSSKYISVGSGNAASEQTSASVIYGVNLRTAPSTSTGKIITMLKKGTVVTILEKSGDFYKVKTAGGQVGYVSSSSKYLQLKGNGSSSNEGSTSSNQTKIAKVISTGKKYLGTPYEYGSDRNTTKTFDCSDFVRQAYKEALGITLPSDSRKQGTWVKDNGTAKSSISSLKAGDLVFFMSYKGSSESAYKNVDKSKETITHVALYLGNGEMLHTYSQASGGVRIDKLDGAWKFRFLFGGSVLK